MSNEDYMKLEIGAAPEPEFTARQVKQENTHVNKDWWSRTISYDQGLELAQRAAQEREDILCKTEEIRAVVDGGLFKFSVGGRLFTPTDHSLSQFSIRAKVPSSTVIAKLREQEDADETDAAVMVAIANNALRRIQSDKVFRMRTYTDGTLRAFVTDRYAPIDNRWYLESLREFLPDGRLSHWRADEDTIYGNVLLPDTVIDYSGGSDSDYGGMISIGNCEIGKRRLSQYPSVFRSICFNGCIWGQVEGKSIKRRHIGTIDLDDMKRAIGENIEYQLPLLPNTIRKFLESKELTCESTSMMKVIAAVVDSTKITKAQGAEVYNQWKEHESQFNSLFGVINGITRTGQLYDGATFVAFDEIAGDLASMDSSKWSRLVKRAETLESKDIENILSVAV